MSNRPRIALITGDFPPAISGIADYVEKLADAMVKLGGDVTVITSRTEGVDTQHPFAVRREIPSWKWRDRAQLIELLASFDIAHIQYPSVAYGRSMMINLLPKLLARHAPQTKSLVTIHDFRVMRLRWRARVAPMLWGVDGLIHVDPRDGPYLNTFMPFGRPPTTIIPIAANAEPVACVPGDRERWRSELGFAADETVVAFFGILYPHKGLPELHEAIKSLRTQGRKIRLLALGDFDRHAEWRAGMQEQLRQDHVVWVQGAPLQRVSECLHAADLAALPFHSGASTNRGSMLATLAHGLPTVTTNGPATPADLTEQFDVSLVPVNSPAALAQAIDDITRDPALAARMRRNALIASDKLSWPTVAKQTLAFYDRLLERQPAQSIGAVA